MIKANITSGETNMKRLICALILVLLMMSYAPARAQDDPAVIGWLYISALDMAEPLFESQIGADGLHVIPDANAVHLSGTAWLNTTYADMLMNGGQVAPAGSFYPAGRIVVAGHNPGVFSTIQALQVGDVLYLASWPEGAFFEVTGATVVNVQDTSWLAPTTEQTLTLVLCMGDSRMIVEAVRSG